MKDYGKYKFDETYENIQKAGAFLSNAINTFFEKEVIQVNNKPAKKPS